MEEAQLQNSHLNEKQRLRFRLWLEEQFAERCGRNSRYSLRAFAGLLQLDPASTSQLLSGKRNPSSRQLFKICARLGVDAKANSLLQFFAEEERDEKSLILGADQFSVIADWYHYAILELSTLKEFSEDPRWITQKLGISSAEARVAVERLKRLNLLRRKNGRLRRVRGTVSNHISRDTSNARKTLQRQVIGKALVAVDECAQDEKDITSITMCIDPKNLDRARELIKSFRRELCSLLESGDAQRVYNLAIQLYPVSKS